MYLSLRHSGKLAARRLTAVKKERKKKEKKDKGDLTVVLQSLNRGFIKIKSLLFKKVILSIFPLTALCDCTEYIPDLVIIY